MIAKIILFLVMSMPNESPVPYQREMGSLEECWAAANEFMQQAVEVEYSARRSFQAGCVVTFMPAERRAYD